MDFVNNIYNLNQGQIGFITDNSSLKDYLLNAIPVMTGREMIEYVEGGNNKFKTILTDTLNDTLITLLTRNYQVLLYRNICMTLFNERLGVQNINKLGYCLARDNFQSNTY